MTMLNRVEKTMMNNPVRRALQRRFEVPRLIAMGGRCEGARALELGCGQGEGISLILGRFGAASVDAVDLDPDMVERARARHGADPRVTVRVGDATRIDAPDGSYDAVFDFGIVHHVPAWRAALCEVSRVLRPGGRFYAEEVLRDYIVHPLWRAVLDHPQEDRFDADDWARALGWAGFSVVGRRDLGPWFTFTVAERR